MKSTKDIEELTDDNEQMRIKTDKEIMEELGSESSYSESESNYEKDGVEFTLFSIKKELKEGHFDKYGSYIPNQSDSEEEDTYSSSDKEEEQIDEESERKNVINAIEKLIELVHPDKNVTDAIKNSEKDQKRMSLLTKYSTELMLFGIHDIYDLNVDELKEKLKQLDLNE